MDTTLKDKIGSIAAKIDLLLNKNTQYKSENNILRVRIRILEEEIKGITEKYNLLEDKHNNSVLKDAFVIGSDNKKEAKEKILSMVSKIDKCILFLKS